MTTEIKLNDLVALSIDIPEYGLRRGQVGCITEIVAEEYIFSVQFFNLEGKTYGAYKLAQNQIMPLHLKPSLPNS